MQVDAMDEDALLQQALALSMQQPGSAEGMEQATPAPSSGASVGACSVPVVTGNAAAIRQSVCSQCCHSDCGPALPGTAAPAPTPAAPSKVAGEAPGATPTSGAPTPTSATPAFTPAAGGGGEDESMADLEVDDPEVRVIRWDGSSIMVLETRKLIAASPPLLLLLPQLALALQMSLADAAPPKEGEEKKE